MLNHKAGAYLQTSFKRAAASSSSASLFLRPCTTLRSSASPTTEVDVNKSNSDFPGRLKIKKILGSNEQLIGKTVKVQGWVRTVRDQKKFSFIEINDGSTLTGIQAVAASDIETYSEIEKFTTGAAVEVSGTVVASIGKG